MPDGVFNVVQGDAPGRPGAVGAPRHRQGVAHRRGGHRSPGDGAGVGRDAEGRHPRARRQEPADRVRRRRPRQRRVGVAARQLLHPGRGLLERHARVRAPVDRARPFVDAARGPHGEDGRRRPDRSRHPRRRADLGRAPSQGARLHRRRRRRGRRAALCGGGRPTDPALAARLVRRADGVHRLHRRHDDRPRGDLRTGDVRCSRSTTRTRWCAGRTTPSSASPPACSPATSQRAHRVVAALEAGTVLDQHLQHHADRAALRRLQAIGHRPREQPAAIEHYTQRKSVYVEMGDVDAPY